MRAFFILCVMVLVSVSCSKTEELVYQNNVVGTSANDLLASTKFTSLRIDLVYVDGFEPNATTVNNVTAFLTDLRETEPFERLDDFRTRKNRIIRHSQRR